MTTCTPECDAEKAVLVEALERVLGFLRHYSTYKKDEVVKDEFAYDRLVQHMQEETTRWVSVVEDTLADTSSAALLAQGEGAGIETLREMAHAFYEGGRPITKEQLDAFCAVGGEEKEWAR